MQHVIDFNQIMALVLKGSWIKAYDLHKAFNDNHAVLFSTRLAESELLSEKFKYDIVVSFLDMAADHLKFLQDYTPKTDFEWDHSEFNS